jgi:thiamine transport system permease protein
MSAALATLPENPPLAARTLGAGRLRAVLEVELPAAAPVLLSTLAFTFSMAVGDANVPLLLGQGDFEPLPLLIYRLVGAYRFPEACAAGLALAALTGFIFFMKDKGDGLSRGR